MCQTIERPTTSTRIKRTLKVVADGEQLRGTVTCHQSDAAVGAVTAAEIEAAVAAAVPNADPQLTGRSLGYHLVTLSIPADNVHSHSHTHA